MPENSEFTTISAKKTDVESLKSEELEKIPLLPRSAWNSQLTYLKVLLKAKQILDKSFYSSVSGTPFVQNTQHNSDS